MVPFGTQCVRKTKQTAITPLVETMSQLCQNYYAGKYKQPAINPDPDVNRNNSENLLHYKLRNIIA